MVITLGQQYNVGEKPTVILYTYINRQAGTPTKGKKIQYIIKQCCNIFWSTRDHISLVKSTNEEHLFVVVMTGSEQGTHFHLLASTSSRDPPFAHHLFSGEYRCLILAGLC